MIKKASIVFLILCCSFFLSAYVKPNVYKIDAKHNAVEHNNKGLYYRAEGNYYDAIQEFSLAIALNPNTQATAIYYNNLGETYMKVGYYKDAQKCFEYAITQYNLNFLFYQNLVKSFKCQKILPNKIKYYEQREEKNSINMVILGLLYQAKGDTRRAIIKLDEFCMREPDLLITPAVKLYIQEIIPKY